jgi:hypothetical protein
MSMKNSSDTIGNRTRDLPACSAVPQPTCAGGSYRVIKSILTADTTDIFYLKMSTKEVSYLRILLYAKYYKAFILKKHPDIISV